jgi:hypothetical protein
METADFWMEQNTDRELNTLHITISSLSEDLIFSRLNVVDNRGFEEGNF